MHVFLREKGVCLHMRVFAYVWSCVKRSSSQREGQHMSMYVDKSKASEGCTNGMLIMCVHVC